MRKRFPRKRTFTETGQAVLALVLGLTVAIVAGASLMAEQVIQHDPIVHADEVDHFAYRALEAGINAFISEANKNPDELTCNSTSPSGGACNKTDFAHWKEVGGTTASSPHGTTVVPEEYGWTNPTFCFTTECPTTTTHTKTPVLYVKIKIYGFAGYPTENGVYYESTIRLNPVNGFLTHIFWTTHEASDPTLSTTSTPPKCTYDWDNGYLGPATSSPAKCNAVTFATKTHVYGPIYSNDSMYISGKPTLGPVQTADPTCLFMVTSKSKSGCRTVAQQRGSTPPVTQTATALAGDKSGQPLHPIPATDSTLEQFASFDGCVYNGPTTIEFDSTDRMTVWSKDTAQRTATGTKPKCPSTHTVKGTRVPTATDWAYVPNLTHGDGVIYVQTSATCTAGANPWDDYSGGVNGPLAQWAKTPTRGTYYYNWWGPHTKTPNCEGDAFVSDNPHSTGFGPGTVEGQLTVASSDDVVITGTIKYRDCGAGFASTITHPCNFNVKTTNDSLGLIAQNYIVVNHPLKDTCRVGGCRVYPVTQKQVLATACTTTQLGTPAAALCNPVTDTKNSVLTIDAAILALNHSFAVDNEAYLVNGNPSDTGVGVTDGTLKIYGSVDQKWRGVVAINTTNGYVKDYDWNSVGAVVTPPHYLAPATASWAISSSPIFNMNSAPSFGAPHP
ncbi:MAG: hypothetical protein ACLP62_07845 [Acidimicrobiales bacterium]